MDLTAEVKQIIAKSLKVPVANIKDSSTLEDFGAESLDVIEIIFDLEEKFDVEISVKATDSMMVKTDNEGDQMAAIAFMSVGEIAGAVRKLVVAKAG